MAFANLPAKAAGDTITLSNYNTIKDNFAASAPGIATAKGDIVVATGANAVAPLTVGNDDDTLVADSGEAEGMAWQIQPAVRVYNSGTIAVTGSWGNLTFDSERFDTNSMHDTGSNTERLTAPANGDGLYLIGAQVEFDTSSETTGQIMVGVRILLNGTTVIAQELHVESTRNPNFDYVVNLSTLYSLSATDYVQVQVISSLSTNVNATGNYSPEFWAMWQRRA